MVLFLEARFQHDGIDSFAELSYLIANALSLTEMTSSMLRSRDSPQVHSTDAVTSNGDETFAFESPSVANKSAIYIYIYIFYWSCRRIIFLKSAQLA